MSEILIIVLMAAMSAFAAATMVRLRRRDDFYDSRIAELSLSLNGALKANSELHSKLRTLDIYCSALADDVDRLKTVTEEFPVEDMRNAAKKEALFFEGLQNIIDYSPENVASLNKEAVHLE